MYWSASGGIYTANMDGTNPTVFVGENIVEPDGLVIDIREQRFV